MSPYQVLFCSSPDYGSTRSFGCLTFAVTLVSASERAIPLVFMGYPKGY